MLNAKDAFEASRKMKFILVMVRLNHESCGGMNFVEQERLSIFHHRVLRNHQKIGFILVETPSNHEEPLRT